jgi:hypothetical protein
VLAARLLDNGIIKSEVLFGGPDLLAHHAATRGHVRTVSMRFTYAFWGSVALAEA